MIIINSDDFGASKEINRATYLAFQEKLISSTTTMVNFKEGFEDAVSYVTSGKISNNAVGIHLNLTTGAPLTVKINNNLKLCENGVFRNNRDTSNFKLDKYSMQCIYEELDAQVNLFKEKFGFLPSHIDSHQHVHTKWPILQCVVRVARKHNIESVRISRNIRSSGSMIRGVYKTVINNFLRFKGFRVTDKFGDVNEVILEGEIDLKKKYEIMVHAQITGASDEVLDVDGEPLKLKLKKMFNAEQWEIVSYGEL